MNSRAVLTLLAVGLACSDSTSVELRGNVAVSFATQAAAQPAGSSAFASSTVALDDTLTSGSDTLVITRAQIVLREIELKPVETTDCGTATSGTGCSEIEFGPVLVDLPLEPGAERRFAVDVPPGRYDEIEFEIHKVGDDPEDAAFRQAHPEFIDRSIRVEGTFNGQPFTFETDLDVEQELDLSPPLTVEHMTSTNITIRVGLAGWFRDLTGALLDPASGNKGEPNEGLIKDNIRQSIEAFEDADEDGSDRD